VSASALDTDAEPRKRHPWLFGIVGIVLVTLLIGSGGWWLFKVFLNAKSSPRQVVHNISLIKQPPPPVPKPPDKPPEPPKVKDEVKIPDPEPKPADKPADDKPPSDKPLAVDAQGGAGSDGFGLAGRVGGTDLLATGGGGAYYTGLIERQFYETLMRNKKIQKQGFRVVVEVELGVDGKVARAELVSGSGSRDLDQLIQAAFADVPPLKEIPPSYLRQVQVRLTNRV
jgi:protein TonB